MDDALLVGRLESLGDLAAEFQHVVEQQRATREHGAQVFARHQFEHQEGLVAVCLQPVDGADVRVVQRRQHAGFAFEAGHLVGAVQHLGRKQFEGHVAAQFGVDGAVDLAHAAGADLFLDLIVEEGLADHVGAPRRGWDDCGFEFEYDTQILEECRPIFGAFGSWLWVTVAER